MAGRRHAPVTPFEVFFSAFGKSVHADVQLHDGEIVVSHAGNLLNEALAAQLASASTGGGLSRPPTRSSPTGKAQPLLPRLVQPQKPTSPSNGDPPARDTATETTVVAVLPRHLAALVALQASDGSWRFDDKFQFVIQNAAPPPPEGISPKLWATAVVLTIFRQFPEYFVQLESAYEKAMLHVDDDVLRLARPRVDVSSDAMECIRPYQNNEAKEIRERLAREAAAKRAEEDAEEHRLALEKKQAIYIGKYSRWRARHLPMETQETIRSALTSEVHAIFPSKQHKPPKQLRPAEMEIRAGDAVECCWARVDGSKLPERQPQWRLCLVTMVNSDGKTINIQYLEEPFEKERSVRLKYVRLARDDAKDRRGHAFDRLRQQWEVAIGLDDELGRLHEVEAKRKWRAPWETRSLPALPAVREQSQPQAISTSSPRRRLTVVRDSLRHKPVLDETAEELHQRAVAAALAYEKVYQRLPAVVKNAAKRYTSAMLFQERFHAFDEFLATAIELVELTVTTVEAINRWMQNEARMFVWQGEDFVLQLLTSLDFLSSHTQVCEWYGDDFAFSMNPFLMAKSIRDIAQDQALRFTAKLPPLTPENPLRVALRMHKTEIDEDKDAPTEVPMWWPQARYDPVLLDRIKLCEAFILSYLRSTHCLA